MAYVYKLIKQVAETDHLSYVGTNYDPDSTALLATANCRYIITISKTVKLFCLCHQLNFTIFVSSFADTVLEPWIERPV